MSKSSVSIRLSPHILFGITTTIAFLLLMRSIGLYPTVFSDEYTYSKFARLVSFQEATIPDYLYFLIYRVTNFCGDGFLGCTRLLNVVFFVSAAPFIFHIGRALTGEKTALLIVVLAMLDPINSYTAYFMPESLYYFSFWVLSYFLLRINRNHLAIWLVVMGVIFGLSSLIKPHAVFLIPALAFYFFAIDRNELMEGGSLLNKYQKVLVFFISAMATKLSISFSLAGASGITIFGTSYTSMAVGTVGDIKHYVSLVKLAMENLEGHLLSMSLLFSVPICHLLLTPHHFLRRYDFREQRLNINIAIYTSGIFIVLLSVVAIFTASASGTGVYETNARLHMRYYNFTLPLLLLSVSPQLSLKPIVTTIISRATVGIPIAVAICYAIYTHLSPYTPSFIDCPELRGFTYDRTLFYVLSGLSLASVFIWIYSDRIGIRVFLYLMMPISVGFSTLIVNQELWRNRIHPDMFDKAGMFARQYLANADLGNMLIVGDNNAGLFRTLFYLDNPKASLETIPPEAAFNLSSLPANKDWLLVIGHHPLSESRPYQPAMHEFTLTHAEYIYTIDFRDAVWQAVVSYSGLSGIESWGTWSKSDIVTFEFSEPLPDQFNIHLVAHAFGPNIGKEFMAYVGNHETRFILSGVNQEIVLSFANPKKTNALTIRVPSPASPMELGLSQDTRRLGIAFSQMKIRRWLN